MLQGQALKYLIIFTIIVKCVYSFEIFISKTKNDTDQNIARLASFRNKTYEIPLFQTHYITIRTSSNDFRHNKPDNISVIGFKFQLRSINPKVVSIRKEIMTPTKSVLMDNKNTILLEDLYILPRKNALGHIINTYPSPTFIHLDQNSTNDFEIDTILSVEGATMDVTEITFRLDVFYNDDTISTRLKSLNILVTQPKRRVDTAFYIIIPFMVVSISIWMGMLLDTSIILGILKKPTPLLIGFVAQYGLMPFLAMAIAKLFRYTPLNSLAIFLIGCCPGSGVSNQWTVIFDGDVNLSAVMSFVSTVASFVMMPLYFYTFGQIYMDDLKIKVPFLGLARSLALVVIPYSIGIVISYFFPKSRLFVIRFIKPMMIFLMLFFLTFGLFVNWYLFKMLDIYTTLTAPLLPFLGFLFGGFIAWICRMNWKHVKTIGIEAGIQNTGIAFMTIMYSFPQPYAAQALIVPMVVAFLSTKPFWIILIIRNQIRKYKKRKESTEKSNMDGELIITNDKPLLNNEENTNENHVIENTQQS